MSDQQNTQDQLSGAMANASLNGDQSKQQQQQQQQQQQNYYNPNAAQSFCSTRWLPTVPTVPASTAATAIWWI